MKYTLLVIVLGLLVHIYKNYYPSEDSLFPDCPFKSITKLDCPGCGSQRATHYLLNLELEQAFKSNALFLFIVPYLLFGFMYTKSFNNRKTLWIRENIYGKWAAVLIGIVVILYWIIRNI